MTRQERVCAAKRVKRKTCMTGSSHLSGGQDVKLYLYDLTGGVAKALAPTLSSWMPTEDSKYSEGLWHSAVVVFGQEYFFNGQCVHFQPGETGWGKPTKVLTIGHTSRQQKDLHQFVVDELKPIFTKDSYDVLELNCNHFSNRICEFLCGRHIPDDVLNQAQRLANLSAIHMLRPLLNAVLGANGNNVEAEEVTTTCGSRWGEKMRSCSITYSSLSCGLPSCDSEDRLCGAGCSHDAFLERSDSLCSVPEVGPDELCGNFASPLVKRKDSRIPELPAAAAAMVTREWTQDIHGDEEELRQALFSDDMEAALSEATRSSPPVFRYHGLAAANHLPKEVEYDAAVPDEKRCMFRCHSMMCNPALGGC
mmetsp:Transcript_157840/g.294411  ORF Transcript_157840/g.294411 Transcript_157840/m.294411 type:complete len:365 (-) Transcript_157840:20-1114(-)